MGDSLRHFEKRKRELLRGIWAGFVLNLLLLGVLTALEPHEPRTQVRLTTTSSRVVIYGYGILGNIVVKSFPNWEEGMSYLKSRNLEIPEITYAYLPQAEDISVRGQSITWGGGKQPRVIFTPDAMSTLHMAQYLRYLGLNSSLLGYSLEIKSN